MCVLFGVSAAGYYKWIKRSQEPVVNKPNYDSLVRQIFKHSRGSYGSPRITRELNEKGYSISQSSVSRIMKRLKLVARSKRKFIHTTDSKHGLVVSEHLLKRDFSATRSNQKWVSDITYLRTSQGWAYLTVIIDLFDRMVIGWHLSSSLASSDTIIPTFKKAVYHRGYPRLFHSDRGVQYCGSDFRKLLHANPVFEASQSMCRKGNCWDNAVAESFFKSLKVEWIKDTVFKNLSDARHAIFEYIEMWYNTQRRHSAIQYLTPLKKYDSQFQP